MAILKLQKIRKVRYESEFADKYVAYQRGRREAFATVRVYRKVPSIDDYYSNDSGSIVVLHKKKYYAITPELGPNDLKVSPRDRVATEVLPDPVVLATLGSMSLDL